MMIRLTKITVYSILFFSVTTTFGQQSSQTATAKTPKKAIGDFMALRFGMFVHFGPVTLRGTEIGWSRGEQVPQADYDTLYKEFDPVLFNADEWAKTAKEAGMKYLTITAKHHDGFCLWPTAFSDYNIAHTPFKRDIVGELARACKKQGIIFCIYFSVLDWHDPDYPLHRNAGDTPGDMEAFKGRMKNELKELILRYKPAMLWFDGYWEKPWTATYGKEIYQFIKAVDANVVVNNRLGKNEATLNNDEAVGDYLTPEQEIGKLNMVEPWESCITLCNQWAWKPNDGMKPLKQCIQTLAGTAGGNGNLLFNIGPMLDGRMEARQVTRLKEVGAWLKKYGAAIYGTKGGPFAPDSLMAATRKGNKINLLLFGKPNNVLQLPALKDAKIIKAYLMNGAPVTVKQLDNMGFEITLPDVLPDENCSVIVLEMDKNVEELPIQQKSAAN